MRTRLLACLLAVAGVAGCASATLDPAPSQQPSDFVGTYDGSKMEVAAGLRLAADRTFEFGLSVGALDMRGAGTWEQRGDTIELTSSPKPVPPEFSFTGLAETPDGPMISITKPNGEPFSYLDIRLGCADGSIVFAALQYEDSWSPEPGECAEPAWVRIDQANYDARSQRYMIEQLGWQPGQTMRFVFAPNDLGVMDLTGTTATLDDGILTLDGPLGRETMRKLP